MKPLKQMSLQIRIYKMYISVHLHRSRTGYTYCLYNSYDKLKEKYEEKHHKIKRRIWTERFVSRTEPAQVRKRREQQYI